MMYTLIIINIILLAFLIYYKVKIIKLNNFLQSILKVDLQKIMKQSEDFDNQRRSFVYSNLKIDNPNLTIKDINEVADNLKKTHEHSNIESFGKNHELLVKDKKCPVESSPDFKECRNCDNCVIFPSIKNY